MTSEDWILSVVTDFYQEVRTDVLIGYQFWKVKDFDQHIPRIASFWDIQLLGSTQRPLEKPFDVINLHVPLNLKKGELGRWLLLLKKQLDRKVAAHPEHRELAEQWRERLKFFEGVFSRFFGI